MTSKIEDEVRISFATSAQQIVQLGKWQEASKQRDLESSENTQEESFSLNRSTKYATVDNLSEKLQLVSKTTFSEFFQIKKGKHYNISSKHNSKHFYCITIYCQFFI